jgi:hypothetical protein
MTGATAEGVDIALVYRLVYRFSACDTIQP